LLLLTAWKRVSYDTEPISNERAIADIDTSRYVVPQDVTNQLYQESGAEVDAVCG